jgi:hypothetical protein
MSQSPPQSPGAQSDEATGEQVGSQQVETGAGGAEGPGYEIGSNGDYKIQLPDGSIVEGDPSQGESETIPAPSAPTSPTSQTSAPPSPGAQSATEQVGSQQVETGTGGAEGPGYEIGSNGDYEIQLPDGSIVEGDPSQGESETIPAPSSPTAQPSVPPSPGAGSTTGGLFGGATTEDLQNDEGSMTNADEIAEANTAGNDEAAVDEGEASDDDAGAYNEGEGEGDEDEDESDAL